MRISARALLSALEADLFPASPHPDRFRPLLDLAGILFHADHALLMILTPDDRFEFHSSQYFDPAMESAVEKMGRALLQEWSRHPFLLFSRESVNPDFGGGLLRKRPFRDQEFACLMVSESSKALGLVFLQGGIDGKLLKEMQPRNLEVYHRLCSSCLTMDRRFRILSRGNQNLLARLERSELEDLEKEGILKSLEKNRGNISRTHVELGIPRMSFYQKVRRYRIKAYTFRRQSNVERKNITNRQSSNEDSL
jgi:hypothetical protein